MSCSPYPHCMRQSFFSFARPFRPLSRFKQLLTRHRSSSGSAIIGCRSGYDDSAGQHSSDRATENCFRRWLQRISSSSTMRIPSQNFVNHEVHIGETTHQHQPRRPSTVMHICMSARGGGVSIRSKKTKSQLASRPRPAHSAAGSHQAGISSERGQA